MTKEKYLQCGYEDMCKKKKCMKCPRKNKHTFILTQAEETVIEDFAVCDLKSTLESKYFNIKMMQDLMKSVMHKMFKSEKQRKNKKYDR